MSDNTPRLGLPYLVASQYQKEVTHNEALNRMDAFVQIAVESIELTTAPIGVEGSLYVIAAGATGTWANKDNYLAQYIGGAWGYYAPFVGMRVWDKNTLMGMVYTGSAWKSELTIQSKLGFFGATPVSKTTVTVTNADGDIGNLTVSATYSQSEVQAFRDKTEVLADDVRKLKKALENYGLV